MKRWVCFLSVVALVSFVALGCGTASAPTDEAASGDAATPGADVTLTSYADQKLCGSCGHAFAKADEHVCDTEHAACEKCGLHAGAELCCKLGEDTAGKTFCGSCGEVAGSAVCCVENAEVCENCQLHKGSPLCCKLVSTTTTVEETTETTTDDSGETESEASTESSTEASDEEPTTDDADA